MTEENRPKLSKHVCLTNRSPLSISDDPEYDILCALADKDVLTMARGLSKEEARSPYPDGLFGLDERATNAAIRKMKSAGLISARRDGNDHVYYLNKGRYKELADFLYKLIGETERA
ncbi:MAG: hypothetical protein IKP20_08440 [Candidatus Methanomethylophilaceae archaeon]|jgi:DNA-binding transcriptional ArsR family regulator|nr:hypothetical protein [Candidatus Methanomethylophilaceae archaeon]